MCLNPGNLVTLEFAPTSPVKEANGYGPRFQVETGGCETDIIADEEEAALVVPHDLLNDAISQWIPAGGADDSGGDLNR